MVSKISFIWNCLRGPRLLRLIDGHDYPTGASESYGDSVLTSLSCAANIAFYTGPLVLPWAYRRGWLTEEGFILIGKFLIGVSMVVAGALFLRTVGRLTTPAYTHFLSLLTSAQQNYTEASRSLIEKYDFQFRAWPTDFDVRQLDGDSSKQRRYLSSNSGGAVWGPLDFTAWLLTHTFGISLVYPGSMGIMGMLVERPLLEGRTKLLQEGGRRYKVVARDGNQIDTMFVQQRTKENGGTLVICCEGNAGFYEIGMMGTPVAAGYSVLGWNHPGFSGSTGRPFPDQEVEAVDAVMQFAIHKLGFKPEDILVYGWSIGGFTSSWLAMNYPDIQGLILDATFDNLEPLALPRMPAAMSGLVSRGVKKFINLDVGGQVSEYPGPLRLIRRTRDEMISTVEGELWSNRANNLIELVLRVRYPELASPGAIARVWGMLATPESVQAAGKKEAEDAYIELLSKESQLGPQMGAGLSEEQQFIILGFLVSRFMTEVETTHCTPLPTSHFLPPWIPPSH